MIVGSSQGVGAVAVERVAADRVVAEKRWQRAQLPDDVFAIVEDALDRKERFFAAGTEDR